MKQALLFSLLFAAVSAYAGELHHFDQIKSAVTSGKSIRIGVDFSQCDTVGAAKVKSNYAFAIYTPNEVVVENNDYIAASLTHFTTNDPSWPSVPVYQFVRYTITNEDKVVLDVKTFDAGTFAQRKGGYTLNCKLDAGAKVYG